VFLTSSKSPPLNIIKEFLTTHGLPDGGFIRCQAFLNACGESHYKLELTGSDSPSQNDNVEIYNDKFGARVRSLLYTAHVSPLRIGPMPLFIACTYTTVLSIRRLVVHHSKAITVSNPTCPASKSSALASVLNAPANDRPNWTITTSAGSS
jgi:hypothetical protein